MLDHRAHRHFTQLLAMQAEPFDQRTQRTDRHAEVADAQCAVLRRDGRLSGQLQVAIGHYLLAVRRLHAHLAG
ncbi:hypothetical protein ABGA94_08360, partial [Stenotrophomonas sp. 3diitr2024]